METSLFITALSKTLPESCLQGFLIYFALRLLFALFKKSTPLLRFNLFYFAMVLLFAGFLFTFFNHYSEARNNGFNSTLLINTTPSTVGAAAPKTQLWLQLSYWTSHYASIISGLYLLGLIFCILKLSIGLINISWFKTNSNLQTDNYWSEKISSLSNNFNLLKTVSVFLSDKISVPLTLGFFKPIIVFPVALINQLSAEQTEAILLHELAHIKRNDYLLNILLNIVQSFLFFNPAIWLIGREINKYREQCCDDLVIAKAANTLAYAHALLMIEEYRDAQLSLALASNGKKYTLLNRIKRITTMKTINPSPQNKLVVLLLSVLVISVSVAWNMPVKKAFKHLPAKHFKPVKEASDPVKIGLIADKINLHPNQKSGKKLTFSRKKIVLNPSADTVIKSKNRFKIVLEDSTGNKKEYNSVEELPADAQKDFLKENNRLNGFKDVSFSFKFPDSITQIYHSKFYDKADLKRQAEEMRKLMNSPKVKKQMEDMRKQFNSPAYKKQMEEMRQKMNSPEFKQQLADIAKQGEEIKKQMNSPEWKKQLEDIKVQGEEIRKQFNSPEWKKQQKKMQKEIEKSQKEWRKSMDFQPKPLLPEKPNPPMPPDNL
jgi:bla regulator protein BlaR1